MATTSNFMGVVTDQLLKLDEYDSSMFVEWNRSYVSDESKWVFEVSIKVYNEVTSNMEEAVIDIDEYEIEKIIDLEDLEKMVKYLIREIKRKLTPIT